MASPELTMKRPLMIASTFAILSACDPQGSALLRAVPQRASVSVNVPTASGQALSLGETSPFYQSTVAIAASVNGGVGAVYNIIDAITRFPPTETDGETFATWGPSVPQGLERNSFRLQVSKVSEGEYTYVLAARPKAATEESDFVALVEGVSIPDGDDAGTGSMDLHWGALRSLDDTECMIGELHSEYDLTVEPRVLLVTFIEAQDTCGEDRATNADYAYTEYLDGAGTLDFVELKNIHSAEEDKPLEETVAVRSQWNGSGAGRSDVRISGGEVTPDIAEFLPNSDATGVDVIECWDASFALAYTNTTPAELAVFFHPEQGDAAVCAFSAAAP
jgi:hypothetical protein